MSDAPASDDDLPRFEPSRSDAFLRPPNLSRRSSRKRSFDTTLPSDPPIFSSDDNPDIGLEDYDPVERVKRQSHGPWWQQSSKPMNDAHGRSLWNQAVKRKRSMSRKIDSAVWMDCSSDLIELDNDAEEPTLPESIYDASELCARELISKAVQKNEEIFDLARLGLSELHSSTFKPLETVIRHPKTVDRPPSPGYESIAPRLNIFLANNGLRSLPVGMLNLQYLTVLSLRNNRLEELPNSIGQLYNLEELNVSCNNLKWLPFELLSLFKAEQPLPGWEEPALNLYGKLRIFNYSMNPFLELEGCQAKDRGQTLTAEHMSLSMKLLCRVTQSLEGVSVEQVRSKDFSRHPPTFLAASPPLYFDQQDVDSIPTEIQPSGISTADPAPLSLLREPWEIDAESASGETSNSTIPQKHRAPSLRELSLRRISRELLSFDQFYTDCPPRTASEIWEILGCQGLDLPTPLASGLQAAAAHTVRAATRPENAFEVSTTADVCAKQSKLDGRPLVVHHHCSACGKFFVQPGSEWFEFFFLGDIVAYSFQPLVNEGRFPALVPFRRTSCSRSCARPTRITRESWNEEAKDNALVKFATLLLD
ncbi:hypothetical protein P152DRAFT_470817 [Eremomyces bilateralis CBS 781.70]|uniref:L domain-like protein n=1 Tax=Eremomyces bilateralis CBS 781.70 TaxID=1392243 RepID=A0A6G1GBC5_9PEZI|nr:uncharacterized protein P152DRAFT_470817 [Eremomyces bilateralis CBS 781.70]KAF1815375.1 hypothetical protein P152DRAFT_470817 [Eremomyces bilateralis CBS 781.70]